MTEARYRGQKVVVVSPDYAEHTKFADHWLAAKPGTDGALAMAMGHVILKEFWVDRRVDYFERYARSFTDLPLLVTLRERDGAFVPDRFLRASDLGGEGGAPRVEDGRARRANGQARRSRTARRATATRSEPGRWNLRLDGCEPALTLLGRSGPETVEVDLPRFDEPGVLRRGVPALRVGGQLVTTVLDLMLAQYGVGRPGLPGEWPEGYDDPAPYTPAWQEELTSVDRHLVARVAREFARNAELTKGRSMIAMGAGTNHWFHSDTIYRTFLSLLLLCGCEGRNGGGWAHYVGQEKVRPLAGLQTLAFALDWVRPPRHQSSTPWFYLATDQWRYEGVRPEDLAWEGGERPLPRQARRRPERPRRPARVASGAPRLRPQPARPRRRGRGGGRRPGRPRRARAPGGPAALRLRGSRRAGELPARADRLARQCARLLRQGPRVLPRAPARDPGAGRARGRVAGGQPAGRRPLARPGATREARPADHDRLPHDVERALLRRRPAGGDVVREGRPLLHRPPSVRPHLQRGDPAAVGGEDRLGRVPARCGRVLPPRREAPGRASRPRRGTAPARHAGRDRAALRRGTRLACRRVRAGAGEDDAEADRRRARLPRGRRQARRRSARSSRSPASR